MQRKAQLRRAIPSAFSHRRHCRYHCRRRVPREPYIWRRLNTNLYFDPNSAVLSPSQPSCALEKKKSLLVFYINFTITYYAAINRARTEN